MQILREIDGINAVHFLRSEADSTVYQYETDEDVDVREDVFKAFARERMPLIGMRSLNPTLEDIFLKVTSSSYHMPEGGRRA